MNQNPPRVITVSLPRCPRCDSANVKCVSTDRARRRRARRLHFTRYYSCRECNWSFIARVR
jgi:hypothetical protein